MSVRKRKWTTSLGEPREAWVVDYTDQDADRVIKTFDKKKDADKYHATVRVDVDQGTHIVPSKSETVLQAAERWIKRVEADGRERATVQQYKQHLNLHIAPKVGAIKLANLSPKRVEDFRDGLLEEPLPPAGAQGDDQLQVDPQDGEARPPRGRR